MLTFRTKRVTIRAGTLALLLGILTATVYASGSELIIKYKARAAERKLSPAALIQQQMQPLTTQQLKALTRRAGLKVTDEQALGSGAHLISLERTLTKAELTRVIQQLETDSELEYISIPQSMKALFY